MGYASCTYACQTNPVCLVQLKGIACLGENHHLNYLRVRVEKFDGPSENLMIFSDTIHIAVLLSKTSSADCVKLLHSDSLIKHCTCSGSLSGLLPVEAPSYSSRTRTNGVPNNIVLVNLLSSSRLSKAFPGLSVLQEYQRARV